MDALKPDEAYGWVLFSIPWRGRRWGLTVLTDGWWFLGVFNYSAPDTAPSLPLSRLKGDVKAKGWCWAPGCIIPSRRR
jgi:hypothetical protein